MRRVEMEHPTALIQHFFQQWKTKNCVHTHITWFFNNRKRKILHTSAWVSKHHVVMIISNNRKRKIVHTSAGVSKHHVVCVCVHNFSFSIVGKKCWISEAACLFPIPLPHPTLAVYLRKNSRSRSSISLPVSLFPTKYKYPRLLVSY